MVNKTQELIKYLICKIHFLIFKREPGEFTKKLLKNLFFVFFGVGGATLITFSINILAIRFLGVTEFGKWNLIGSMAEFFVILPLWGLTYSCLRYLGTEKEKKDEIIGSAFRIVFLFCLVFFPIYFILSPFLNSFLKLGNLYNFAFLYGLALVFFYLFQSFFQGLGKFKKLSFLWLISAFVFVIVVCFYLFYSRNFSFESLFYGNIWRLFLIILIGFLFFRKILFKFDYQIFKKLFHYGTFSMLSVFAGFFSLGSMDNLMLNYFLGPAAVGLYSVYYIVFSVFVGKILNSFSQVFLPMAAECGNIKEMFQRVIILFKKLGFFFVAGNFLLSWLLFKFYGNAFVFDWQIALLMAISITLYCFLIILGNIIISTGIYGAKIGVFFAFTSAIINVILNLILIPRMQILGAVIGTIFTILIMIVAAVYFIKVKLIQNE